MNPNLIRDLFEGLIVFAIGGMLCSSIVRIKRHQIHVVRCASCGRTTSRVYENCPRCGG